MKAKCEKASGKNGTLAKCLHLAQETQVFCVLLSSSWKSILHFRNNPIKTSSKSVFDSKMFEFWHKVSWNRKYFFEKILTSSINVIPFIKYICNSSWISYLFTHIKSFEILRSQTGLKGWLSNSVINFSNLWSELDVRYNTRLWRKLIETSGNGQNVNEKH